MDVKKARKILDELADRWDSEYEEYKEMYELDWVQEGMIEALEALDGTEE